MSALHVYLKPFADDAGSAYVADWIEVTKDVTALGTLTQTLDNTEYDIGVFRASNVKLALSNHHGHYSGAGEIGSIFKFKRGDTLVKITYEPGDGPLVCGFFQASAPTAVVSEEVPIFEGLLSDIGTQSKIDDADVDFQVLGYESLLSQMEVPFGSVSNGDSMQDIIIACLDQAPFNERVIVDTNNILSAGFTADDVSSLENKTVLEALKTILQAANSVLYVRDGAVHVGSREATDDVIATFYGPGAVDGIEDIVDIQKYRSGLNRVRNYWTWRDTTVLATDATSVAKYGVQKKEIALEIVTDSAKQLAAVEGLRDEFSSPKREMELEVCMTPAMLELFLLDRVVVDYPSVPLPVEGRQTAQYEVSIYDDIYYYADELLPLTIENTARFKIMARMIDFKKETLKFALREI